MKEIQLEQLHLIHGGSFLDGFCTAVGVFSAGYGLAILAGATAATGGAAAWVWGSAAAGCAAYGAYRLATS